MSRSRSKKKTQGKRAPNAARVAQPRQGKDVERPAPAQPTQTARRLKIVATLQEDVHHGSGMGGAGVDALIARDKDGRPVIWATHLVGLLRAVARRKWSPEVVQSIFGERGGKQQAFAMSSLYTAENPLTRIWRSAARESFTNRAPRDDTLRAVEYVPKGTVFEGYVEVGGTHQNQLWQLVSRLDTIGSGKASSAGNVTFAVSWADQGRITKDGQGPRLRLLLENIDPICVAATANPGNLVPTESYIPGRVLLGALAAWLSRNGREDVASRLVAGTEFSVGDALPVPGNLTKLPPAEVCPAPLTLVTEKGVGSPNADPWWSGTAAPNRLDRSLADEEGKRFKRPDPHLYVFRRSAREPWSAYVPGHRVRLRNGRPDPEQLEPSLFAVEQIVEKTQFLTEIAATDKATMDALLAALEPVITDQSWLRIGRGGIPMRVARATGLGVANPQQFDGDELPYLVLTSDLLVRDEDLVWMDSLDAEQVPTIPGWPDGTTVDVVAQQSSVVYGFNGTSRLWRHPANAIRRGSVFKVTAGVEQLADAIRERKWLGERTHEGFGRFGLYPTLPGVTGQHAGPGQEKAPAQDHPSEVLASETFTWFTDHGVLAAGGRDVPSLSQWYQLISELQSGKTPAIDDRLNPTTAGKRAWKHPAAQSVLYMLEEKDPSTRGDYVESFVGWLRPELRGGERR